MNKITENMINKLPDVLKTKNIIELYEFLGNEFEKIENLIENNKYYSVVSKIKGTTLDGYGQQYLIYRDNFNDDNYKKAIYIEQMKRNFIPTLDKFISIINDVTGYKLVIKEGWKESEKAKLYLTLTIPQGFDENLLFDLDKLYSSGVELDITKLREAFKPKQVIGLHNYTGHRTINRRWIAFSKEEEEENEQQNNKF